MTTALQTTANTDKVKQALERANEIQPGMTFKALMQTKTVKQRFEEVLGKKAAGFMSSVITAYSSNDALQKCDPMSVISSAAIAAALDLPINSNLGFAHIVPYKGVATFQMGWKGFVQLAQRSGQYLTINVTEVHEGELVKSNRFSGLMEFDESKKISEKVVGYVSYFKLLNGFEKWFYMSQAQMEAHAKRYSQSYKNGSGQWAKDFVPMGLKTVVKLNLSKWGILSIDMQKAITFDQAAVSQDEKPVYIDATAANETETASESKTFEEEGLPVEALLKSGEYEVESNGKSITIKAGSLVLTTAHADTVKLVIDAGKKSQDITVLYWPGKGPVEIESVKAL